MLIRGFTELAVRLFAQLDTVSWQCNRWIELAINQYDEKSMKKSLLELLPCSMECYPCHVNYNCITNIFEDKMQKENCETKQKRSSFVYDLPKLQLPYPNVLRCIMDSLTDSHVNTSAISVLFPVHYQSKERYRQSLLLKIFRFTDSIRISRKITLSRGSRVVVSMHIFFYICQRYCCIFVECFVVFW